MLRVISIGFSMEKIPKDCKVLKKKKEVFI